MTHATLATPKVWAYGNDMSNTRLTPEKWLLAGLDALATLGPHGLAAEPLARQLGTTKGSFYWHFKDVPTYQSQVIDLWRQAALVQIRTNRDKAEAADKSLRQLGRALLEDPAEAALRVWAASDPRVVAVLSDVDTARLSYLTDLLRQLGLGNPDFARALLAALVGLPQVAPGDCNTQIATFDTLVDTVLALL